MSPDALAMTASHPEVPPEGTGTRSPVSSPCGGELVGEGSRRQQRQGRAVASLCPGGDGDRSRPARARPASPWRGPSPCSWSPSLGFLCPAPMGAHVGACGSTCSEQHGSVCRLVTVPRPPNLGAFRSPPGPEAGSEGGLRCHGRAPSPRASGAGSTATVVHPVVASSWQDLA